MLKFIYINKNFNILCTMGVDSLNNSEKRNFLIRTLVDESDEREYIEIPQNPEQQRQLLRALMNVRQPKEISKNFLDIQDEYLKEVTTQKGITKIDTLQPIQEGLYVWQGDITTLDCDAIVNAANSNMTGCYIPNHKCVDNFIHTYAGVQLRLECDNLIKKQGYPEPTGMAKITNAYNLPCKNVIHTVGPIVRRTLTDEHCDLLKKCYLSCLELANEKGLNSIAFSCISTGAFRFPNDIAAQIAVETVKNFMKKETTIKRVIFNVFKDINKEIYERLLTEN